MSHNPLCSKLRDDVYCDCWERVATDLQAENSRLKLKLSTLLGSLNAARSAVNDAVLQVERLTGTASKHPDRSNTEGAKR